MVIFTAFICRNIDRIDQPQIVNVERNFRIEDRPNCGDDLLLDRLLLGRFYSDR